MSKPNPEVELQEEAEHIRNHYWDFGFEVRPTMEEVFQYLADADQEEAERGESEYGD